MRGTIFICLLCFLTLFSEAQQNNIQYKVLYANDQYTLTASHKKSLDSLSSSIKDKTSCKIILKGHTDNNASHGYNVTLSKRRVSQVYDYLLKKGFAKENVTVSWHSYDEPFASNETNAGKGQNRRTDITFITSGVTPWNLEVESQVFKIRSDRDTTLVYTRSGTKLEIPADAFDSVQTNSEITIRYREFRSPAEFVASSTTMIYHHDPFIPFNSDGMFEVRAYLNDSIPLDLKEGKEVTVYFRPVSGLPMTNLYYFNEQTQKWEERQQLTGFDPSIYQEEDMPHQPDLEERYERRDYINVYPEKGGVNRENPTYYPLSLKKVKKGVFSRKRTFTVVDKSGVYSELKVFDDYVFVFEKSRKIYDNVPDEGTAIFDPFAVTYSDIRMNRSKPFRKQKTSPKRFQIYLKLNNMITIDVEVIPKNMKVKAMKIDSLMALYKLKYEQREKRFNDSIDIINQQRIIKKWQNSCFRDMYNSFSEEERSMLTNKEGYEVLKLKYKSDLDKCVNARKKADSLNAEMTKDLYKLSITGMGVWNCDQLYRVKDPVYVNSPIYVDRSGNTIYMVTGYLMIKELNGVLTMNAPGMFTPYTFAYSRSGTNKMFLLDGEGRRWLVTEDTFKNMPLVNSSPKIIVEDVTEKITDVTQLENYAKFR